MAKDVVTNPLSSIVQNKIEGCSSFFEPNMHESFSTSQVESYLRDRENRAATGDCEETGTNMANYDHSIWMAVNKERRMGRYQGKPIWETEEYFDDNWMKQIDACQSDLIKTEMLKRSDVRSWFIYNYDPVIPR